ALHVRVLIGIDFGKNELFVEAQAVVAMAIKRVWVQTAEVAHAGQSERYQAIQELVHAGAAKGYFAADIESLTQPEGRDALAGLAANRLLAGDFAEGGRGFFDVLLVGDRAANAHADHDLLDLRQ